jgi:hypothetical protein
LNNLTGKQIKHFICLPEIKPESEEENYMPQDEPIINEVIPLIEEETPNVEVKKLTYIDKLLVFIPPFPQILVISIILAAFIGIGYLIYDNGKGNKPANDNNPNSTQSDSSKNVNNDFLAKIGENSSNAARGLITVIVAIITVAIAFVLILSVMLSSSADYKERFNLGKEILTIFIGILGTVIGFYFGSAPVDNGKIPSAQETVAAIADATAGKSENISTPSAIDFENKGFTALIEKNYDIASRSFAEAYKKSPTLHNVDEINSLLKSLTDEKSPDNLWQKIYCQITVKNYTWKMPAEIKEAISKEVTGLNCKEISALNSAS